MNLRQRQRVYKEMQLIVVARRGCDVSKADREYAQTLFCV